MTIKKSDKANLENKKGVFFLTGLIIALGFVLFAFEWKSEPKAAQVFDVNEIEWVDYGVVPPTPNEPVKPPPPKIDVPEFILVDNNTKIEEPFEITSTDPGDDIIVDFNSLIFSPEEDESDVGEEIMVIAEEMPKFPGGELALIKFISRNIKYPMIAQENGVEGKVYVGFVIDEFGNIDNVAILRGVDASLDNEALRVVRSMPRWQPGKQGGKAVKVRYNVPILFDLQ